MAQTVFSLFSGVGGIEAGLERAGLSVQAVCESWPSAQAVLRNRFPEVRLVDDVNRVETLNGASVLTAGFPCTDLSQAGRMAGLDGSSSGLVFKALDLVDKSKPAWVLLENVPHMLVLNGGSAIRVITDRLERAGYQWAYRTIDTRSFGLPHRRRRVFLLASRRQDPLQVLFRSDAGPTDPIVSSAAYGFYWTEGNRGLGWAPGAIPTLKGSTTASIPSPPAVWLPRRHPGSRIATPSVEAAEVLQGFRPGWTKSAPPRDRWKLVGNAVSVPVAEWIGTGLTAYDDSQYEVLCTELGGSDRWPSSAWGRRGKRWAIDASEYPVRTPEQPLIGILQMHGVTPLSVRATDGFRKRLAASSLRHPSRFMDDLVSHVAARSRGGLVPTGTARR